MDKFSCFFMNKSCPGCGGQVGFLECDNKIRCGICGEIQLPAKTISPQAYDPANIVINAKIKELRHLLVLQCEKLREMGQESVDLNQICNAMVAAERLMAFVVDNAAVPVAKNQH